MLQAPGRSKQIAGTRLDRGGSTRWSLQFDIGFFQHSLKTTYAVNAFQVGHLFPPGEARRLLNPSVDLADVTDEIH